MSALAVMRIYLYGLLMYSFRFRKDQLRDLPKTFIHPQHNLAVNITAPVK